MIMKVLSPHIADSHSTHDRGTNSDSPPYSLSDQDTLTHRSMDSGSGALSPLPVSDVVPQGSLFSPPGSSYSKEGRSSVKKG